MPDNDARDWVADAVSRIEADFARSADTHLIRLELPALPGQQLYLKDESTHPTGSLKHRLARSLFLYSLCNGWLREGMPVVEASSGSTAISEAYFARLIGVPFVAVVPEHTAEEKLDQIRYYGGECRLVAPGDIYGAARRLARHLRGHYMDQFCYAERATDWRGNNNIAETMFAQLRAEPHPRPRWVVVSAGTGGTSATIGRYLRYRRLDTRLCVADPERSVFFDSYRSGRRTLRGTEASRIEGIGRPRVEPSFLPTLVDRMIRIPDAASIASIHFLERMIHRKCGGSTGTNLYAAFLILGELAERGIEGSVVTMICDSGERYLDTYYDRRWLRREGLQLAPWLRRLERFADRGRLPMTGCDDAVAPRPARSR